MNNEPTTIQRAIPRIETLISTIRALRVRRWCAQWPAGHSERPTMPAFVAEFERLHGPLPASAERVLGKSAP